MSLLDRLEVAVSLLNQAGELSNASGKDPEQAISELVDLVEIHRLLVDLNDEYGYLMRQAECSDVDPNELQCGFVIAGIDNRQGFSKWSKAVGGSTYAMLRGKADRLFVSEGDADVCFFENIEDAKVALEAQGEFKKYNRIFNSIILAAKKPRAQAEEADAIS